VLRAGRAGNIDVASSDIAMEVPVSLMRMMAASPPGLLPCWCERVIVLFPDPTFGADIGQASSAIRSLEDACRSGGRRFQRTAGRAYAMRRSYSELHRPDRFGSLQPLCRDPLPQDAVAVTTPTVDRPGHLRKTRNTSSSRLFGDQQHALLRFGEHDFVRVMPVSRWARASDRFRCRYPRLPISQVEQVSPAAPMS